MCVHIFIQSFNIYFQRPSLNVLGTILGSWNTK